MPHLSPMNWIMMNFLILMIILLINSTIWWKLPMKFNICIINKLSNKLMWNWL